MPLLGSAALLLSFDIAAESIAEHDDWHTHEHLPERLSIPGFLRGSRWICAQGGPRYMVLYEVTELATLSSPAYLERLNNPSAWTAKMMPHYRGMTRGLCSVTGTFGFGVGNIARLIRFKPEPGRAESLHDWLVREVLPRLPSVPGVGGVHLLQGVAAGQMTNEQRIRGADAAVDSALILTGYRESALLAQTLDARGLESRGASVVADATYRIDYALTSGEMRS